MKKILSITLLLLLTSVSAHAGKAKPGSGPVSFNDKELKDFHIYITKKLNSSLIKEYGAEGFSFNFSGKPFYANHYIITGTYKRIFQWEIEGVNRGPQKELCSGPECKIFAKKNKIVWKGAKKKISRKVTIEELKDILRELGFYN